MHGASVEIKILQIDVLIDTYKRESHQGKSTRGSMCFGNERREIITEEGYKCAGAKWFSLLDVKQVLKFLDQIKKYGKILEENF